MRSVIKTVSLAITLFATGIAYAGAPAEAPAGSNGLCKDGTYSTNATKNGACKGHKGVKEWYAAGDPAAAPAPAATAAKAATAEAAAPAKSAAKTTAAAPGGGPGLVWVNTSSKVYHCQSDKWYGKTKQGAYLSEADAKAKGNRPEGGKACS